MLSFNERFVTDADGRRIAVQLDIADYYRLLETLRLAELLHAPKPAELSEAEREAVRREALDALQSLRVEAEQRSLNNLSEEEIAAEIEATRIARRIAKP